MSDISKLLNDEKALLIFEHLTVEVHLWEIVRDEKGKIKTWKLVYINPPALESWGRSSLEEIRGMTADQIFGSGSTKHYMKIVSKIMGDGCPYSYQDYFDNLNKHFQFTSVPLGNYFVTTGSDITEIVENQKRIEAENQELELRVKERTAELEKTVASLHNALEESKRLRQEMEDLAIHDPLTDLYNRRYLDEFLAREFSRSKRSNSALSVIFCDIDKFKQINDNLGHEVGDIALRKIAETIKKTVRSSDIICRYGGDELVIIMPETSLDKAAKKAEEIRKSAANIDWQSHTKELANITLSLGVAEYPTNAANEKQLLKNADEALLWAKEHGRNRVEQAK